MGAFLALCAPGEVLVHNHAGTASGKLSQAAYDAAGAKDKLTRSNENSRHESRRVAVEVSRSWERRFIPAC